MLNSEFFEKELYKRELLIEKYTQPTKIELSESGYSYIWTNNNGELHRINNLPARIQKAYQELSFTYYVNNKIHRNYDLPSKIIMWKSIETVMSNYIKIINFSFLELLWFKNGIPYRTGLGPHSLFADGTKSWYNEKEQLHRENDLPARISKDGTMEWFKYGKYKRKKNKPTIIKSDNSLVFHQEQKVVTHMNIAMAIKFHKDTIYKDRIRNGVVHLIN